MFFGKNINRNMDVKPLECKCDNIIAFPMEILFSLNKCLMKKKHLDFWTKFCDYDQSELRSVPKYSLEEQTK